MRPRYTLALLAAIAAPTLAHADSIFSFAGASIAAPYASPVTGTITIDTTAGTISSYDFSTEGDAFTGTGASVTSSRANNLSEYTLTASNSDKVLLYVPGSLVGYSGTLCTNASPCTQTNFGINLGTVNSLFIFAGQLTYTNFATGSLAAAPATPTVAATPEPSSLFLLGTGILSLAAAARRRLRHV